MALKQCPDCGQEVSNKAFACPKCGRVLRKPSRSIFGKLVALIFWLFEIIILAYSFGGTNGNFVFGMIIWFFGTLILGIFMLMTKPSK